KEYRREDYERQFTIRVPEFLAKIERIKKIYKEIGNIPEDLFKILEEERQRLLEAKGKYGDHVSPFQFE
ncbi:phosphoenolpyruvate carboxykinase, partial [Thermococci archaeon]